jgi:hypothetical protein
MSTQSIFGTSAPSVRIAITNALVRQQTVYVKLTTINQYWVLAGPEVVEQALALVHRRSRMKVTGINPGLAEGVRQTVDMSQVYTKNQCRLASG